MYAIVDGYSVGRYLAERLAAQGVECVHVRSSPDILPSILRSYRPDGIVRDLGYVADVRATARTLRQLGVERVFPGTESGVEMAERLARAVGVPWNTGPTNLRRDKSAMARALRGAGLAAPAGVVVRSPAEAVAGAAAAKPPFVVKPLDSGGTDHVFFCSSPDEAGEAVARVLEARTIFGRPNRAALLQERLVGTEYYFNTVSAEGLHRVVESWRYAKLPGPASAPLYDYEEPVDHASPELAELHDYVRRALTALGVRDGAAHSELILTERGPVLLECGARLCGGFLPEVIEREVGFSQLSVLAETLVRPASLAAFDEAAWTWPRSFRNVFLINDRAGVAGDLAVAGELRALPSFVELAFAVGPGEEVQQTTDFVSSPGYVYLSATSRAALERDYRRIRALERRSPFVRRQEPTAPPLAPLSSTTAR
jgi:biotin carboxylase